MPARSFADRRSVKAHALGHTNAMTIDVEEYFHVEALASTIDRKD
jgi:hypothetical protein